MFDYNPPSAEALKYQLALNRQQQAKEDARIKAESNKCKRLERICLMFEPNFFYRPYIEMAPIVERAKAFKLHLIIDNTKKDIN